MARSYAEFYIRYLFSTIVQPSIEDVQGTLDILDLPGSNRVYLKRIKKIMADRPYRYRPSSEKSVTTNAWLLERRISELWRQTDGAMQAVKVIEVPSLRELVEALILSPLDYHSYEDLLPSWLNQWGVNLYHHYFFNTGLMTTTDLLRMVDGTPGLKRAMFYSDSDPVAARALLDHLLGRDIMAIPVSVISRKVVDMCSGRLLQLPRAYADKDDALMMKRYVSSLEMANRLFEQSGGALEDLQEALGRAAITHGDQPAELPLYRDIAGGRDLEDTEPIGGLAVAEGVDAKRLPPAPTR